MRFLILLLFVTAANAQSVVTIDQIGDLNSTYIVQTDTPKTSSVTSNGNNNIVDILQQGTGNHTASIQNLKGNGNIMTLSQNGSGSHEFNIINVTGTTNNNNTINATQSGGLGSNKWFNIWLNGTSGATVLVTQDNATTPDSASMSIQCLTPPCGTWTYVKH